MPPRGRGGPLDSDIAANRDAQLLTRLGHRLAPLRPAASDSPAADSVSKL